MQYDTLISNNIKLRMVNKLNEGSMRKFYLVSQKIQTSGFFGKGQTSGFLTWSGKGDAEPVGIVLGANKDDLVVQFATQGISNRLFVSKYQMYLPNEDQLRGKLAALLDNAGKDRKTKRRTGDKLNGKD